MDDLEKAEAYLKELNALNHKYSLDIGPDCCESIELVGLNSGKPFLENKFLSYDAEGDFILKDKEA